MRGEASCGTRCAAECGLWVPRGGDVLNCTGVGPLLSPDPERSPVWPVVWRAISTTISSSDEGAELPSPTPPPPPAIPIPSAIPHSVLGLCPAKCLRVLMTLFPRLPVVEPSAVT